MGLKTFIKSSFDEMSSEERKLWLKSWRFGALMWALVAITAIICTYLYFTPETAMNTKLDVCQDQLSEAEDVCEVRLEAMEDSCAIMNENACEQSRTLTNSLCN